MADFADSVILVWILLQATVWNHFGFYSVYDQLALDKVMQCERSLTTKLNM